MTKERILPKPDRYAVCSPEVIPIKEYYKGVLEEIFLFFHPFIQPKTISYELFEPDTYPMINDIIKHCEMLTWEQFLKISKIENYKQLDSGIRTSISRLNKNVANEEVAKTILDVCKNEEIIAPSEGCFPVPLITGLLESIKKEGHEWIWYGDELGTERKLEYIDDLVGDCNAFPNHPINLFTHNHSILLTTHWDSHFSMLCSDKNTVNKIVKSCNLEGFYCGERTKVYWSLYQC
ncbi:DUF2711 family protein [Psychrobacillus sp. FSL K6-1267]|uniref:DUF2711 family protein n=1 Tax=Psychrobacillus sp. FSL K6-1267 TaxID=2921543 RepID=UPI0030FD1387